jgi:predicted Zn-ribbon and HTH transcriptional regulator
MKRKPFVPAPAITPQAMAVAAGRKARRVQKKLHEAESEMHSANEALAHAPHAKEVDEAVRRNADAERKVHEAVEELEVMKEMLEHAQPMELMGPSACGKTGQGVKSLLPHLKSKA